MKYKLDGTTNDCTEIIVNISGGGFRMTGDKMVNAGKELIVRITLPDRKVIKNTTVAVIDSKENGSGAWETRAQFTSISDSDRYEIIYIFTRTFNGQLMYFVPSCLQVLYYPPIH